MARNRLARVEFFSNYVNILFMVLSLIQGLAFQDLAVHARELIPPIWGTAEGWVMIAYVVVCLAVLVRVLQTYITVALDYGPKYVTLHDVVFVFLVGLLEAFLFNELGSYENGALTFEASRFWTAMAFISFAAGVIYVGNVFKVSRTEPKFLSKREEREEQYLQGGNAGFMVLLGVISVATAIWASKHTLSTVGSLALAGVAIAILSATTAISLSRTFGIRAYFTDDSDGTADVPKARIGAARQDMTCRAAVDTDIDLIIEETVRKHEPLLLSIFGVSSERIAGVFREAVGAEGSSSPFSFRNWVVVTMPSESEPTRKVQQVGVGALLVHSGGQCSGSVAGCLCHSVAKVSRGGKLRSLLSANTWWPIGGFSEKWANAVFGKRGAEFLREKLEAFMGPAVGDEEIRVRMCIERDGAPAADVADCAMDALSGSGVLTGLIGEKDKILKAALAEKGLRERERLLTTITVANDKLVLEHWA